MGFVFTWVGALGVGIGLVFLAFAFVVNAASGGRKQARILSLLLAGDGISSLLGSGLMYLTDDPSHTFAWQMTLFVLVPGSLIALYPLFWGTLPTPLGRPFRTRTYYVIAILIAAGTTTHALVRPQDFVHAIVPGTYAPWDAVLSNAAMPLFLLTVLVSVGGLVVAFDAWRRSEKGSLDRRRNGLYAWAFGVRDALYLSFVVSLQLVATGTVTGDVSFFLLSVFPALISLLYAAILAYAILTTQLFQLDLRLKTGIRRSGIGLTFVVAFLIGAQFIQNFTNARFGVAGGAVVAGLLLFALRPIERMASRVADAALPGVEDTAAYRQFRAMELYKTAAVELAIGGITIKERRVLEVLRSKLGIAVADAAALERSIAA